MPIKYRGINFHQGDVQLFQIDTLPEGSIKIKKCFIAEAKNGASFHALFGNYNIFQWQEYIYCITVIDVREESVLNHTVVRDRERLPVDLSSFQVLEKKDHDPIVIPAGIYLVGIQQQFDPMKGFERQVSD